MVSNENATVQLGVVNVGGENSKSIEASLSVWKCKFSPRLISLCNRYSLFNKRQTLSKTKTKGEVSGGGRKPWRQKGTGRARQGSIRSPQWRGGGVVFGPTGEQSYHLTLNKKVRKQALSSLLSKRLSDERLIVIDRLPITDYKTKTALSLLKELRLSEQKILLIISHPEESNNYVKKSFENLSTVSIASPAQVNIPKLLAASFVVFTAKALKETEERLL